MEQTAQDQMTKAEALRRIDELKEYIENINKPKHPPYRKGQIYRHRHCGLFMLRSRHAEGSARVGVEADYDLVALGIGNTPGNFWDSAPCFSRLHDEFTYVGMFDEVFKLAKEV